MNDATAGSVTEKSAGTPAAATAQADNGSTATADSLFSGLSEGTRSWVETKGYKSHEDIAKAAQNAESKIGSMISAPAPDATPDEWNKFYSKLGRPESPDKYEFKRPEGLPPELPYSDDLAKAAKPWMHEAGLNPKQAQTVHDRFVGFMAEQQQAQKAKLAAAVETTHDTLVKDWGGPPDSEVFKKNLALANRSLEKLGLKEAFTERGILLPDGSLTNPQIAKALAAVGETMFAEDKIDDKGGGGAGENPFKRDASGSVKSPTAISALIKSDPERAERLAREVGEDINIWMPRNPR